MSSAATEAVVEPAPKSKKKLFLIIGLLAVVLVGGGVGTLLWMQQKAKAQAEAEAEAEDGGGARAEPRAAKPAVKDGKNLPTFMAIEAFTVNLADREGNRYAQVSITLELDEAKTVDLIKGYMPAVRNNVLLLLSSKTSQQLLEPQGKLDLARQIQREVLRPLGVEVEDEDEELTERERERKRRKPKAAPLYPVRAVHFSNFIVQ